MRDLIALVLEAFKSPSSLDSLPVVPTSSESSSLHLSAIGREALNTTATPGGGNSPASSITSEQQSLADVEEPAAVARPSSNVGATKSKIGGASALAAAGRKLSFTRAPKKK